MFKKISEKIDTEVDRNLLKGLLNDYFFAQIELPLNLAVLGDNINEIDFPDKLWLILWNKISTERLVYSYNKPCVGQVVVEKARELVGSNVANYLIKNLNVQGSYLLECPITLTCTSDTQAHSPIVSWIEIEVSRVSNPRWAVTKIQTIKPQVNRPD